MSRSAVLGALGIFVASSACQSAATAPSGVHATIDFAPDAGWSAIALDHITVVATSGDASATACLYPPARAVQLVGTGPDPCADWVDGGWPAPSAPTGASWSLPLSINFDVASGSPVHVVATAALGGSIDIGAPLGHAEGRATSAPGTSPLELRLVPTGDVVANVTFGGSGLSTDAGVVCPAENACVDPSTFCHLHPKCYEASPAVACDGGALHFDPRVDAGCATPSADEQALVVTLPRLAFASPYRCFEVSAIGRFSACADAGGACTPTADCTPPVLTATLRASALDPKIQAACPASVVAVTMPPFAFDVPFEFVVPMPASCPEPLPQDWNLAIGFGSSGPSSCAFDLVWRAVRPDCHVP